MDLAFPVVLTQGGDDRVALDPRSGVNKYYVSPYAPAPGDIIGRSSCTCNPPTSLGHETARRTYEKMHRGELNVADCMESIRRSLIAAFLLDEKVGVFLCPSGSDAEYFPLLVARCLYNDRSILNIVTCDQEVGGGTLNAAGGRYFSHIEPIPGHTTGPKKAGDPLEGLSEFVTTVAIDARCAEGRPRSAHELTVAALMRSLEEGLTPIVHVVPGSKTGICESVPCAEVLSSLRSQNGLLVVDACQGRMARSELRKALMECQAIVLFSGSKFCCAPSFCGCVFVPPGIMDRLRVSPARVPASMRSFIGCSEVPPELEEWRRCLEASMNVGLALRWVAAMTEIEATQRVLGDANPDDVVGRVWRDRLREIIRRYPNLSMLEADEGSCCTIVCVRVKKMESNGFLSKVELGRIHKAMTQDLGERFIDPAARQICFVGQPVHITPAEGVLRIAMGCDTLRQAIDDLEACLREDEVVVHKMSLLGAEYDKLE